MTASDQVTLCFANHPQSMCSGIQTFFDQNFMADATLECHGYSLKAHRLILAIFSPILRNSFAVLSERDIENSSSCLQQQNLPLPVAPLNLDHVTEKGSYVQYLLEFLYRGEVTLPRTGLGQLLRAAEVLAVEGLAKAIRKELDSIEGHDTFQSDISAEIQSTQSKIPAVEFKNPTMGDCRPLEASLEVQVGNKRRRKRQPVKMAKALDEESCLGQCVTKSEPIPSPLHESGCSPSASIRQSRVTRRYTMLCKLLEENKKAASAIGTVKGNVVSTKEKVDGNATKVNPDVSEELTDEEDDVDDIEDECPTGSDEGEEDEDTDDEDTEEENSNELSEGEEEADEGVDVVEGKATKSKKVNPATGQRIRGTKSSRPFPQQQRKTRKDKGQNRSLTKEYRKLWRQNRPVMKCDYCDYETRDKTSFKSHTTRHDPAAERFVCDMCGKSFRSKKGIRCHRLSHNGPDRLHACTHCDFHTPQRWNWLQHLAVIHKVDPDGNPLLQNIVCQQCNFTCVAAHQLKAHVLRKHTLDKPFKCQQCDYSTVIRHELEKHVGIRHENERKYMCEACGFRSQTQGGLTRHKRSHTGAKPFKCDMCGMCYADRGKLKIHLLRHTSDEKPFVCHICGHACRRRDNLRMHLKRIHGAGLELDVANSQRFHLTPFEVAGSEQHLQLLHHHEHLSPINLQHLAHDQQLHHSMPQESRQATLQQSSRHHAPSSHDGHGHLQLCPERHHHHHQHHHRSRTPQELSPRAEDHIDGRQQNVHVEQLSVLHSVPSALQCANDRDVGCDSMLGDENHGPTDCDSIRETQCASILHSLPPTQVSLS